MITIFFSVKIIFPLISFKISLNTIYNSFSSSPFSLSFSSLQNSKSNLRQQRFCNHTYTPDLPAPAFLQMPQSNLSSMPYCFPLTASQIYFIPLYDHFLALFSFHTYYGLTSVCNCYEVFSLVFSCSCHMVGASACSLLCNSSTGFRRRIGIR